MSRAVVAGFGGAAPGPPLLNRRRGLKCGLLLRAGTPGFLNRRRGLIGAPWPHGCCWLRPRGDPGRLARRALGRADHRARVRHGDARLHRHQRGPAPHRRGPRHRYGRPPVDRQRLHAHARRADPPRRGARGPVRAAAGVRGGSGVVRGRLPALRDRAERGGPHRRPGAPGRRRRAAHARVPRAHPGQFPSGRPGAGRGTLVRVRRGRGGRGAVRRRLARRRARLAVGVPAESAARRDLRTRRAPPRTGVAGSGGARPVRCAGGRPRGAGARRGDVRADRGAGAGCVAGGDRVGRRRAAAGGRVRTGRAAAGRPHAAAVDLPLPAVHLGQPGDLLRLRGPRRLLLPLRDPAPGGGRVLGAGGRYRAAAHHRADAALLRVGR
ncbi:hypothetical protein A3Q37_03908 [Streptomyces sp. PTY087I2]|nr:hypothetical protein A3Q37_03908 [Streptomyces sp. PTY087I2]